MSSKALRPWNRAVWRSAAVVLAAGSLFLAAGGARGESLVPMNFYEGPYGPNGEWVVYELRGRGSEYAGATNWTAARADAQGRMFGGVSGDLTSIGSQSENDFIDNQIVHRQFFAYIGATDDVSFGTTEGNFVWTDGTPFVYSNWSGGEPNNAGAGEHIAEFRQDNAMWNDNVGTNNLAWIIKYPTLTATPQLSGAPAPLPGPAGNTGTWGIREVYGQGNLGDGLRGTANHVDNRIVNAVNNPGGGQYVVDYQRSTINILDSGDAGYVGGGDPYEVVNQGFATLGNVENIALALHGRIDVPTGQAGDWTFSVNSDDGFEMIIRDLGGNIVPFTQRFGQDRTIISRYGSLAFDFGRGATGDVNSASRGVVNLAAGQYDVEVLAWEGGGGASLEIAAQQGVHSSYNTGFKLIGAPAQTGLIKRAGNITPAGWDVVNLASGGANDIASAVARLESHWDGSNIDPSPLGEATGVSVINYADPQDAGANHGGVVPFPGDTAGGDDNFYTGARAMLDIDTAGEYTFMILSDDSAQLRILGSSGWTSSDTALGDGFEFGGCCSDRFGSVTLAEGEYPIQVIQQEGGGGSSLTVWGAWGFHRTFDPDLFQLLGENIDTTVDKAGGLQLVGQVPEPSSVVLAMLGLIGMIGLGWRRTRRSPSK